MRLHRSLVLLLATLPLTIGVALVAPPSAPIHAEEHARYQCAMHPEIVSDRPGICPICQMRLERTDGTAETAPAAAATSAVPGHAAFTLSPERQQLIGVRRGRVERRPLTLELRVPGTVASDPELYRTVVEYREALRGGTALAEAARLKLRRLGLSPSAIRDLEGSGFDARTLLVGGEHVWVYARVYASDLGLVQSGQRVTITTPAEPGATWDATIAAVDAIVDPTTRTARVRIPVTAPGVMLRPETWVHVVIAVTLGESLAVPADAVLDTGTQQLVFVVDPEGRFTPRRVTLGRRAGDFIEVLAGVEAGEEVVTSANFLIDSESRFRAAVAAFGAAHERTRTEASP